MINGYYIAGLQGIVIGFFLGIECLILLDVLSALLRERDSRIINFIKKFKKSNEVKA